MSPPVQVRNEIDALLVAKAQADPAFRQALLLNPKAAIEKEFGVTLPAAPELRVVEETASTNYLVLPATVDAELSEADLEAVAGGWFGAQFGQAFATALDGQSTGDLGAQLQQQVNEANRASQAKSNIASTHNKTADALVQNIRG